MKAVRSRGRNCSTRDAVFRLAFKRLKTVIATLLVVHANCEFFNIDHNTVIEKKIMFFNNSFLLFVYMSAIYDHGVTNDVREATLQDDSLCLRLKKRLSNKELDF